jgi:hypothetical protein
MKLPNGSSLAGKNVQLVNGTSFTDMYGTVLNTTSPYTFKQSNNIGALGKSAGEERIFVGRTGVVRKDSAAYYFTLGDVEINGSNVEFENISDTIKIKTQEDVSSSIITKPFSITDKSEFVYSVMYGYADSIFCSSALKNNDEIRFKLQLIDNETKQVIGEYDNVKFDKNNVVWYNSLGYEVNMEGIGNKTVRLRLIVSSNVNAKYSLMKLYNNESVIDLGKANIMRKKISYNGATIVSEYALNQNYPNPFNPSTVIKYQLPDAGAQFHVILNVYDVLGRKVATLADGVKSAGYYSTTFDASRLASGIYFARLIASPEDGSKPYTKTLKMLMMK